MTEETLSYEDAFRELQAIVERLETESLALDETLRLYERGRELVAYCTRLLEAAELRLETLNEAENDA